MKLETAMSGPVLIDRTENSPVVAEASASPVRNGHADHTSTLIGPIDRTPPRPASGRRVKSNDKPGNRDAYIQQENRDDKGQSLAIPYFRVVSAASVGEK